MNTAAQHIPEDELTLVALAELPPEEAALAVAHLRHCDVCRNELARLQGDLVAYALTAPTVAPSGEARARLLQAVAREAKFIPQPAQEPATIARDHRPMEPPERIFVPEQRGGRRLGWIGWALAAVLAGVIGWQFFEIQDLHKVIGIESTALNSQQPAVPDDVARARQVLRTLTDPAAMQVALRQPGRTTPPHPEAHASYNPDTGDLIFIASHLKPLHQDRTYELWLLPGTGENAIPAGLFRPDANGNASVVLPQLPKNVTARGFGVTVEQDGGSATPTMPVILAGT